MTSHDFSLISRITGVVLSLTILATSFSACLPWRGRPTVELVVITFACDELQKAVYRAAAKEFHEANPDIKVRLVSIEKIIPEEIDPFKKETNLTHKIHKLASGADTFLWYESAVEGGPLGLLLDLSPFIEADRGPKDEDFLPGLLERFRWKGGTWGLPAGVNLYVIVYNQATFEEAGIEPPAQDWTWEDLLNKARQLTEREGEEVIRYGFADFFRGSFYSAVVAHGGRLVDDSVEPPVPTLDDPRTVEAVRWYVDLALAHKVMPTLTQAEAMKKSLPPDLRGKAAMWVNPAELGALPLRVRPNLRIAPLPEGSPIMVSGYFISAGTAHPEEAWRWLQFLSRHIAPPGQLPARRGLVSDSTYVSEVGEEALAVFLYAVEHALPPLRPAALIEPLEKALETIFAGEELGVALSRAQEEAMTKVAKGLEKGRTPEPIVVATPKPEKEAQVTITLWGGGPEYELLAKEFREAHPEIEVEIVWPGGFHYDLVSSAKASGADCFLFPVDVMDLEEAKQVVLNLEPFIEADPGFPLDDYYPQALEAVRYDGSPRGIPAHTFILGLLYYDRALFDEAGLPYPDVDWTWEDFFVAAKSLSEGEGAEKRWGLGVDSSGLVVLLEAMSGGLVDNLSSPKEFRFDSPETVEAAQRLAELGRADAILAIQREEGPILGEPVGMKIGRFMHSPKYAEKFGLGIVPLPKDRRGIADKIFHAYYISADTPHPEACWEWIKFLSGQILEGRVPPRRSLVESEAFYEMVGEEVQAAYLKASEYEDSTIFKDMEDLPGSSLAYRLLAKTLEEIVWEGADVREALARAQRKAEAYVDCLRRSEDPKAAAEACFKEAKEE
jgi:multiple sugar transport system substrate-binding protein